MAKNHFQTQRGGKKCIAQGDYLTETFITYAFPNHKHFSLKLHCVHTTTTAFTFTQKHIITLKISNFHFIVQLAFNKFFLWWRGNKASYVKKLVYINERLCAHLNFEKT